MHHAFLVVTREPDALSPGLDDLLRPPGYRPRLRQQTRSVNFQIAEKIETHFDLTWKQAECADPSLGFLAVVNRVCRTKSFELVSGGPLSPPLAPAPRIVITPSHNPSDNGGFEYPPIGGSVYTEIPA